MPDATELAAVSDIKTMLGITSSGQDTLLALIKAAIEQRVKKITGRDLLVPSTPYTEYYNGDGGNVLRVDQRPIISVTSIYSDPARNFGAETLIPAADLIGDAKSYALGFVELLTFRFLKGLKSTKITYSAGYSTVPADLSHAVRMIVCKEFKVIDKKMFAETSQQVGDMQITLSPDKWPKDAMETIQAYRRIDF